MKQRKYAQFRLNIPTDLFMRFQMLSYEKQCQVRQSLWAAFIKELASYTERKEKRHD